MGGPQPSGFTMGGVTRNYYPEALLTGNGQLPNEVRQLRKDEVDVGGGEAETTRFPMSLAVGP